MKILNLKPLAGYGGGRFHDIATFDAEIVDGLRLNGLRLSVSHDGKRFVFSPAKHGVRFAQFAGEYAKQIADAAWTAKEGRVAHAGR